ncbi:AAA family ATPase [Candidatus Woesearchaeota archaeon]|nr:AAA family ATPase [Candidatus Woesearchaeota archaeon]
MSKYYGQSLPYGEKITIIQDGLTKRLPIGQVVEGNMQNLEVPCFDKDGKLVTGKVTGLIRHPLKSKILLVKTRSGRQIRVTDYHSLFALTKRGIESVKTSELKKGSFIAVPKKLPFSRKPFYRINLLPLLKENDHGLTVRNVQPLVRKAVEKLGLPTTAKLLKVREKYVYDIIGRNVGIRVSKFVELMSEAGIETSGEFIQIYTKGKSMPSELVFTEEFWAFLGLWLAEGSYTSHAVRVSVNRNEEKYVSEMCNKLFGNVTIYRKPNSNGSDIIICSTVIKKLMKDILGFNSGARKKRIPDIAYNLSKEHTAALLRGFISGDGHLNPHTPAPMVEIATESPELADDMVHLLLNFGIVAKVYGRKNRPQKRICFADTKNLDLFRAIGFFDAERNAAIYSYVNQNKASRRDRIPLEGLPEAITSNYDLREWKGLRSIGAEVLQRLEEPALKILLESDIYWDRVVEIAETEEHPEYVYDISVDQHQNFIAGFGGIFAHNSEQNLRKKFEEAEKNAPSIIFIDEIDAIASKREEVHGEVERRVVAQLLALMDGLKSRGKVVVIAASNVPNMLDPALRRPGRFDREIEIGVPGKEGRLDIMKIHTRNMPLSKNVNLREIAAITHGFVGADLAALCKEAAMIVLRRVLPELSLQEEEPIPKEMLEKLMITRKDFKEALKVVRPSAMREVLVEVPSVKWTDIGGLESVKQELIEAVEWPIKHADAFKRLGVNPPKGILLYGAPGTGKTMLAKAVATESEANFIQVKGPELLSKWVGESEKAVREIFKKGRQTSPTIIFFDEIDSIAPRRGMSAESHVTERVVNQLLTEMDGLEDLYDVVVIGATNRPDMLDHALLRPGRFDRIILTPIPEEDARIEILKVHTKQMPLKDVDIKDIAKKTDGYVGADMEALCREAAILALRKDMNAKTVGFKAFEEAMRKVRPSVTKEIEEAYENITEQFKQTRAKQLKEDKPAYMG